MQIERQRNRRRRRPCRQCTSDDERDREGYRATNQCEWQVFHEQLTDQSSATGTERAANADFAASGRRPSEQQRRKIDTRDQQNESSDRGEERDECRHTTLNLVAKCCGWVDRDHTAVA
jgi:hypothetical protein